MIVGGCAANSYMFLCSLANALGDYIDLDTAMPAANPNAPTPIARLLAEILERLTNRGVLDVRGSFVAAAHELEEELRGIGPFPTDDHAATVLALRLSGWPPAQATSASARAALGDAAFGISFLLATDDADHVADFLRHAEMSQESAQLRPIEELIPIASRAITEYRRLTSRTKSRNER